MALSVKDPEADRLAREVAARTGETLTRPSSSRYASDSLDCEAGRGASDCATSSARSRSAAPNCRRSTTALPRDSRL